MVVNESPNGGPINLDFSPTLVFPAAISMASLPCFAFLTIFFSSSVEIFLFLPDLGLSLIVLVS